MTELLAGKVVAVTGAGRGIGRAVAIAAAAHGARVVVADLGVTMAGADPDSEVANAVADEIRAAGGEAVAVAADVATMQGGEDVVGAAIDTWGRIDGAVTPAGILRKHMLHEMTEAEWDDVIGSHLKGHFTVFRAASAAMVKQGDGGSLVGFTSGGYAGLIDQPNYSAAKGGIVSLVRSAAVGLRPYGITANAIAPSARTRMSERIEHLVSEIGDPEDVAQMVLYLLSDLSRHVTGQVYSVIGGRIAIWNQPWEIRSMYSDVGWTPETIATEADNFLGQESFGKSAAFDPRDPNTGTDNRRR